MILFFFLVLFVVMRDAVDKLATIFQFVSVKSGRQACRLVVKYIFISRELNFFVESSRMVIVLISTGIFQ